MLARDARHLSLAAATGSSDAWLLAGKERLLVCPSSRSFFLRSETPSRSSPQTRSATSSRSVVRSRCPRLRECDAIVGLVAQ